jgi:hypothetical protein
MFHLQTRTRGARNWKTVLSSENNTKLYSIMRRQQNLMDSHAVTTTPRDWRVVDDEQWATERLPFYQREASWAIVLLTLLLFIGSLVLFGALMR